MFIVYLAGDNDLSDAGDKDVGEIRTVGSSPNVNVVAEFDNAGDAGTVRYHVGRDGEGEEIVPLGDTDSGSPEVLLDFIGWAAESYPAERYGPVFWNHGGGWEPSEVDRVAAEVKARNYNVREASERTSAPLGKVFFRPTLRTVFNLQSPQLHAVCCDDGTGHSLDTVEFGKVLAAARASAAAAGQRRCTTGPNKEEAVSALSAALSRAVADYVDARQFKLLRCVPRRAHGRRG
jgi:hypothetical protein